MSSKSPGSGPRLKPSGSFLSPARLAFASASHPWLTVAVWLFVVVFGVFGATQLDTISSKEIRGSESQDSKHLLEDEVRGERPATETVVIASLDGTTVNDPVFEARVEEVVSSLRAMPENVASVTSYYETGEPSLVSADSTKTIVPVTLIGSQEDAADTVEPVLDALAELDGNGFMVKTAGDGSIDHDITHQFEKDLKAGERIGIPAALVVLLVVFGAAVAAGVPILLGFLGIVVAVGITGLLSKTLGVDNVVINMITMIGLAVGIDYTLFIIERTREERRRGLDKIESIVAAGNTASRAVVFSGLTVIVALAGLYVVPANIFQAISIGASLVVVAAMAIALTLLPAVLSLMGNWIDRLSLPGRKHKPTDTPKEGFFDKTTRVVMKHPVISVVSTSALLIGAAIPVVAINMGSPGISQYPDHLNSVQAFQVLDEDFSAGRLKPVELAIKGDVNSPEVAAAVDTLTEDLNQDGRFATVSELQANEAGTAGLVTILLAGDATAPEALDAIRDMRSDYIPDAFDGVDVDTYVGGTSAETVDYIDTMKTYLPIVIGFVLTLSFVLLLMVFRSIVIPLKAIVMNLLSVGAAYGLLVLVFQEGFGADLLGFQQTESIAAFLPVFLFAILFGLSMDYHVFLLSRIQERFQETRDNAGSVAFGLRSTAHIITGAAAIMMVVFSGFAMGSMVELQQMGFGLAVAVFLDATVVRSILVPASMELLGERNWYFPSWLNWLPRIQVEGSTSHQPVGEASHGPVLERELAA
ncbi:MAG: MMPL family transporter [Dehalococcoidia bacterium]